LEREVAGRIEQERGATLENKVAQQGEAGQPKKAKEKIC
jgi:hypothetical protein